MSCLGVSDDGISLCTGSWDSLVCFWSQVQDLVILTLTSAEDLGVVTKLTCLGSPDIPISLLWFEYYDPLSTTCRIAPYDLTKKTYTLPGPFTYHRNIRTHSRYVSCPNTHQGQLLHKISTFLSDEYDCEQMHIHEYYRSPSYILPAQILYFEILQPGVVTR